MARLATRPTERRDLQRWAKHDVRYRATGKKRTYHRRGKITWSQLIGPCDLDLERTLTRIVAA